MAKIFVLTHLPRGGTGGFIPSFISTIDPLLWALPNFTRSGILGDGNWECLLHFTKDAKKLYEDALKVAHNHFDASKGFDECERASLSLVNRLQLLDKPATSLEELESYLTELYQEISSIA